jgi:hypothetical protein
MELFVEMHVRSEDHHKGVQHFVVRIFVPPFYFVSYYFLELNMMISFLIFRRPIIAG